MNERLLDPRAIHIYVDGSCYKNPGGRSGCAAIAHFPEQMDRSDEQIVDFGCAESSNNRMELMACIKALKWVREDQHWMDVTRVQIVTDSTYITNNIPRAPSWKKNKWRNRYGQPMLNDDLWDQFLKAREKSGVRADFVWQKGKRSAMANQVDKAAKAAAKRAGLEVDTGYRPGGVSRSMVKNRTAAQRFPASGQTMVIRPYVKKIMHKGEVRLSFHVFDEGSEIYVDKFFAFAEKALAAELHMGNGHRVRFNSDVRYPCIVERIEAVLLPRPVRRRKSSKV